MGELHAPDFANTGLGARKSRAQERFNFGSPVHGFFVPRVSIPLAARAFGGQIIFGIYMMLRPLSQSPVLAEGIFFVRKVFALFLFEHRNLPGMIPLL